MAELRLRALSSDEGDDKAHPRQLFTSAPRQRFVSLLIADDSSMSRPFKDTLVAELEYEFAPAPEGDPSIELVQMPRRLSRFVIVEFQHTLARGFIDCRELVRTDLIESGVLDVNLNGLPRNVELPAFYRARPTALLRDLQHSVPTQDPADGRRRRTGGSQCSPRPLSMTGHQVEGGAAMRAISTENPG